MSVAASRHSTFRSNIRSLLDRNWLSQREAADRIGVPYKWLRRLCHHGIEQVDIRSAAKLDKLASHFGLRVSDLWRPELPRQQRKPAWHALIKWSGSKRHQAAEIVDSFPDQIETYYEPFVGGGSVLWHLMRSKKSVGSFECSDSCQPLIGIWKLVQSHPRSVVDSYVEHWERLGNEGETYFLTVRGEFNVSRDPLMFFFLLRTCRAGIVRFNSAGEFTTAFHHGRRGMKPEIVKEIVHEWWMELQNHNVTFKARDYARITPKKGDFVYLDPPYATSKRTKLYEKSFDHDRFVTWLRRQDCRWALSYDDDLADDFECEHRLVDAGCRGVGRLSRNTTSSVEHRLLIRRSQSDPDASFSSRTH